jgi:DNA uptake protein ComE-like DNA-binding protein
MRYATLLALAVFALGPALLPSDGAAQQAPAVPGAVQQLAKQIDVNKATDAQLKPLPGLNRDDVVKKITAARSFKQVEDLKKVVPEPVFVIVTP